MTVCNGPAARETTPGGGPIWGTCYACPEAHPLRGDPVPHMLALDVETDVAGSGSRRNELLSQLAWVVAEDEAA